MVNGKRIVGPPLYYKVEESIRRRIEDGTYREGDLIPAEPELQREFQVSRITVRRAVDNLVQDGLLRKQQGFGTIVTHNLIKDDVRTLEGFTEKMRRKGRTAGSRLLQVDRVVPAPQILTALRLPPESEVLRVVRVRLVDGIPLGLFNTYIPLHLGLREYDDLGGSLFDVYARHGVVPTYSDRTMHAVMLDAETAQVLQMKDTLAALQLIYVTYDGKDEPIEYAEGLYRGDLYYYKMRVYRTFCDVSGGELHEFADVDGGQGAQDDH